MVKKSQINPFVKLLVDILYNSNAGLLSLFAKLLTSYCIGELHCIHNYNISGIFHQFIGNVENSNAN